VQRADALALATLHDTIAALPMWHVSNVKAFSSSRGVVSQEVAGSTAAAAAEKYADDGHQVEPCEADIIASDDNVSDDQLKRFWESAMNPNPPPPALPQFRDLSPPRHDSAHSWESRPSLASSSRPSLTTPPCTHGQAATDFTPEPKLLLKRRRVTQKSPEKMYEDVPNPVICQDRDQ
jgi:hypothetical protein